MILITLQRMRSNGQAFKAGMEEMGFATKKLKPRRQEARKWGKRASFNGECSQKLRLHLRQCPVDSIQSPLSFSISLTTRFSSSMRSA